MMETLWQVHFLVLFFLDQPVVLPYSTERQSTTNRRLSHIMEPSAEVISSCLNLMRRLPPKDIEKSLAGLVNLVPEATDELLQRVDQVCPAGAL